MESRLDRTFAIGGGGRWCRTVSQGWSQTECGDPGSGPGRKTNVVGMNQTCLLHVSSFGACLWYRGELIWPSDKYRLAACALLSLEEWRIWCHRRLPLPRIAFEPRLLRLAYVICARRYGACLVGWTPNRSAATNCWIKAIVVNLTYPPGSSSPTAVGLLEPMSTNTGNASMVHSPRATRGPPVWLYVRMYFRIPCA